MPRQRKTPTLYCPEYQEAIKLLRATRRARKLTLNDVAQALGYQASAISKIERCELRLDIEQLRRYCAAVGLPLGEFIAAWEAALAAVQPTDGAS